MINIRKNILVKESPEPPLQNRNPLFKKGDYVFYTTYIKDSSIVENNPNIFHWKSLRVYGTIIDIRLHTYQDAFAGTTYDCTIMTDPEFHENYNTIEKFEICNDSVINVKSQL